MTSLQSSSSSLRPHPTTHSPTSSVSSQNTTPTSPYFTQHTHISNRPHPYASSQHVEPRHQSSLNSLSTTATSVSSTIHHPRPPTPPLLHPPPGQGFSTYLRGWGQQEMIAFLNLYRCGQYATVFQRNDIDGKVLMDLDMAALKDMGISKVGERVKLLGGIKDLRKRAAASASSGLGSGPSSASRVELRLNGSATPPIEQAEQNITPVLLESSRLGGSRLAQPSSGSTRRLNTTRPPPLDLQHYSSSRQLPQAYQNNIPSATSRSTTPRPIPALRDQTRPTPNSNATITSASVSSSVPAPNSRPTNLNLRAPPPRDAGRRSPSPVNADVAQFVDRPLPPAPALGYNYQQSSAAEYASSITQQHQQRHAESGRSTPTWGSSEQQHGLSRAPTLQKVASIRNNDGSHRKSPSLGAVGSGSGSSSTPAKQMSPIKSKFSAIMGAGRQTATQPSSLDAKHPFAATRSRDELQPERQHSDPLSSSTGSIRRTVTPTPGGHPIKAVGQHSHSVSIERSRSKTGTESLTSNNTNSSISGAPSLDDLRKQLVKFVNAEDGTMRTVNVSSATSGVEIMERALKKFGKWGTGTHVTTDTESDEDGDRLEVDGWGVYAESDPDYDSKPLSEASLLGICLSHRDGSAIRDKGLTLRRTRKLQNRKNMQDFFGEAPPPPMSPTSPTPFHGPRLGIVAKPERDSQENAVFLTPTRPGSGSSKKMNRASTVSVMSGLGVPMPDVPPSPSTTRSPSSASFLSGKKKSMYNFFGHRPPSELISNHLAEYFPSAKRKDVEKARHSMLRMSSGPKRLSMAPSDSMGRMSLDVGMPSSRRMSGMAASASQDFIKASPPRKARPGSRGTLISSPPPAATIPEEAEIAELLRDAEAVPRVSVSNDDGRPIRASIDGESDQESLASITSQPPLLPPFEPSNDSLADSFQSYSTASPNENALQNGAGIGRPKSIALNRRNSGESTRSRISMLSQLRRNRDRSDNASLLTVDEITAEVENRRASTITFEESDEDEEEELKVLPAPPPVVESVPEDEVESEGDETEEESSEEESEEDSEEDEDEDEDEAEEDDEDAEHGRAFTSTGSKRIIKWIKGALIGAGSFGSVYLGMDAHNGLLMAVKQVELPTGSARNEERKRSMVSALEREIELLKELQHENIVQYLDSSADGNHLNIFLEYVPGGSVAALLNNYGAFEEALVRNFVRQILTGLNYLHEREIIHRDIKGANILVDNKGGIKISDFGISKKVENNLMSGLRTNRPSLQGSVFWMAPEIVKQTSYTSKADIWSVGCLVVEMLTGTHPWADLTQMQAIFRIGSLARPNTPSDISPEAADLLKGTFEIDHNARPTAAQLLNHPFIAIRDSKRASSAPGHGTRGGSISVGEAQRKMGMAMAAAGQGMGGMMGAKG
ncbi:hypothetical protein CI109_106538 [Kwoniella shandongensis]|uniref:mitogen-activated protein kinase kinase kinase n=1 Tax=Kwoniella shandongensis TaxID=1734106 RepID=A0A5M6C2M2_9TREE|nr:uncharacterized protein CI109_002718 [Kwoniella shandongensis]KAA5528961.1 hypothetical protein CI109_002718 [Kwoniella shandongensis]